MARRVRRDMRYIARQPGGQLILVVLAAGLIILSAGVAAVTLYGRLTPADVIR